MRSREMRLRNGDDDGPVRARRIAPGRLDRHRANRRRTGMIAIGLLMAGMAAVVELIRAVPVRRSCMRDGAGVMIGGCESRGLVMPAQHVMHGGTPPGGGDREAQQQADNGANLTHHAVSFPAIVVGSKAGNLATYDALGMSDKRMVR